MSVFDYMVGQFSKLERKSIEPIALQVEGGTIRGLQRFISDVVWDEDQMRWNYHQLVAEEMGDPAGVLMFDETGFAKKGKDSVGVARAIQFSNSIPMRASACAGWAANRRQAAAILVSPTHLKSPIAILRSAAITCGMWPQRT